MSVATHPVASSVPQTDRQSAWLPYVGLLLVVGAAAFLRLHNLMPLQRGALFLQDYDEAVWDSTAQLFLQGHLPYRDFFATLPPGAIYLLAAALRVVNTPWGSPAALMATRYASVTYGLATIVVVYFIGKRLGGSATGLLAAALLAFDGMVVGMDRRAMLEPPLDLFSALAILVYLAAFDAQRTERRAWALAATAGLLSACAAMVKTPGFVVVLAIGTVSVLRRRWAEALALTTGMLVGWLVLAGPFLFQAFGPFVKQVYFFQLLRPADGVTNRLARVVDIWHDSKAWLTVRLGLVGAPIALVLGLRRRALGPWCVIVAWAGWCGLLIVANNSYWSQYYVQLAVPLSLLAGATLAWLQEHRSDKTVLGAAAYAGPVALVAVLAWGLLGGSITRQWRDTVVMTGDKSPSYIQISEYLRQIPADAPVLVFEPNYSFLASRVPAGFRPGHWLIDSYGEMLYWNLDIEARSLGELAGAVLSRQPMGVQEVFWRRLAQERALQAFERAQYVIVDGRARYQLHPDTLSQIEERSERVIERGSATLRRRF